MTVLDEILTVAEHGASTRQLLDEVADALRQLCDLMLDEADLITTLIKIRDVAMPRALDALDAHEQFDRSRDASDEGPILEPVAELKQADVTPFVKHMQEVTAELADASPHVADESARLPAPNPATPERPRLCAFTGKDVTTCVCTTCRAHRGEEIHDPELDEPDVVEEPAAVEDTGDQVDAKRCKVCAVMKPADQYSRNGRGPLKTCRSCMSAKQRAAARKSKAARQITAQAQRADTHQTCRSCDREKPLAGFPRRHGGVISKTCLQCTTEGPEKPRPQTTEREPSDDKESV